MLAFFICTLGSDDMKEVSLILHNVESKYTFVGNYWKVPGHKISSIQESNMYQADKCLYKIIEYWLNHNTKKITGAPPITFNSVVAAMRDVRVGGTKAATDFESKRRNEIEKEVRKDKRFVEQRPPNAEQDEPNVEHDGAPDIS